MKYTNENYDWQELAHATIIARILYAISSEIEIATGGNRHDSWGVISDYRKQPFIFEALSAINESTYEGIHNEWLDLMEEAGWKYGDSLSPMDRTHPNMVSWYALPDYEKRRIKINASIANILV